MIDVFRSSPFGHQRSVNGAATRPQIRKSYCLIGTYPLPKVKTKQNWIAVFLIQNVIGRYLKNILAALVHGCPKTVGQKALPDGDRRGAGIWLTPSEFFTSRPGQFFIVCAELLDLF